MCCMEAAICRDLARRPIRIAAIGDNGTQMLERLVFIFHGSFDPVLGVQIHHDAALIKTVMALSKIRFYDEREIFLIALRL